MKASRFLVLVAACLAAGSVACGGHDGSASRTAALPMSPSPAFGFQTPSIEPSGQFGTRALRPFPDRQLAFQFRRDDLEQMYRTYPLFPTRVNPEGSVIWVSEYLRYRVSQCSPSDSFSKIVTQINGGGVPAPCTQSEIPFPGREEALSFRRQLETVYASRNEAPAVTRVNDEGDVIWTMEYLRYVLSGCSQSVTISKISTQINGGGVPADCSGGGGGGNPTPDPVADFSVTPNDLKVANPGQCVTESATLPAPPSNIMRCKFDGGLSTPSSGLTYSWDFGVKMFTGPTLQNETLPCGSFVGQERDVTLTVRTSDGKTSSKKKTVPFVKASFC
jgi:hypothetical protein